MAGWEERHNSFFRECFYSSLGVGGEEFDRLQIMWAFLRGGGGGKDPGEVRFGPFIFFSINT